MPPKEQKGKQKELPAPTAPLLLTWDPMEWDIPEEEKRMTVRKAHEIIRKVLPATEYGYIPQRLESQETSLEEMFQILQSSLVQVFQSKFQSSDATLDLVHNRQIATETLIGAV